MMKNLIKAFKFTFHEQTFIINVAIFEKVNQPLIPFLSFVQISKDRVNSIIQLKF